MKTVGRYLFPFYDESVPLDGSYLSTLVTPEQVFVHSFFGYDPAKTELDGHLPDFYQIFVRGASDNTVPTISSFTMSTGLNGASQIDVGITSSDNEIVQTLYLLVSSSQTTEPTATEIKASGVALPGTTTSHTVSNLEPGVTHYGWLMARDQTGNESLVVASTPATLDTAPDVTAPVIDASSLTASSDSVDITISISDAVA